MQKPVVRLEDASTVVILFLNLVTPRVMKLPAGPRRWAQKHLSVLKLNNPFTVLESLHPNAASRTTGILMGRLPPGI